MDALLIWYSKVGVGVRVRCFVLSTNLIGGLTWNGSIVLDTAGKLGKILIGMNRVLGEIPVTVKLRTGVKDGKNTAHKLMPRLGAEWGVGCLTVNSLLLLTSKNVKFNSLCAATWTNATTTIHPASGLGLHKAMC